MTVNTENIVTGPYTGNDVADEFSYDFRIENKTQIEVYQTIDDDVQTVLTVDTDYTVDTVGDDAGGTISRIAGALPTGYKWWFRSAYDQTQLTAFGSQGGFFPDVHEAAMDKMTFLIQQLQEEADRSVKVDVTSEIDPDDLVQSLLEAEINAAASATQTALDRIATNADVVSSQAILDSVVTTGDTQVARVITEGDTQDARVIAEGDTQVTRVGDFVATFDTVASLTQAAGEVSLTKACFVKDLYRGGSFIYDATKVAENNNGTNFNGWVRQYQGWTNLLWFGADRYGVEDSTQAIIDALASFPLVGTTSTTLLSYYDGVLYSPTGKYRVTGQIEIPLGVSLKGDMQSTNYNLGGLGNSSFGSCWWMENVTTLPAIKIVGAQLSGSACSIVDMKFTHGVTIADNGPYAGMMFDQQGTFMINFKNCDFFQMGYTTALGASVYSNGTSVENCRFIKIGDAKAQQTMPPATGYTYGNAIDFSQCFDSFITNTFIEGCGGTGALISGNTKVSGCFIDLNYRGIDCTGDRCQIIGTNCKWNQTDGIRLSYADGVVINGCVLMGNNYQSATTFDTIGFAINITDFSTKYFTITGNNMVDDYEAISSHTSYKTVRQGGIRLGTGADTTGVINGNVFSDADAQWDGTLTSGNPFITLSKITGGSVVVSSNQLESGGVTNLVHTPFTTVSGTTLGTVIKRIAYRDSTGTIIGQIPLYDIIS